MTFFGDQTENIIKSLSKKKIFFQYDQICKNKIPKETIKMFEESLKDDPICSKLYDLESQDNSCDS